MTQGCPDFVGDLEARVRRGGIYIVQCYFDNAAVGFMRDGEISVFPPRTLIEATGAVNDYITRTGCQGRTGRSGSLLLPSSALPLPGLMGDSTRLVLHPANPVLRARATKHPWAQHGLVSLSSIALCLLLCPFPLSFFEFLCHSHALDHSYSTPTHPPSHPYPLPAPQPIPPPISFGPIGLIFHPKSRRILDAPLPCLLPRLYCCPTVASAAAIAPLCVPALTMFLPVELTAACHNNEPMAGQPGQRHVSPRHRRPS